MLHEFIVALCTDLAAAGKMLADDPTLLSQRDPCGETALHYVVVEDELEAARWLLARGAEVETRNQEDGTPLSDAAGLGYLEMVKLLLAHGASPNVEGMLGTPLGRAESVEMVDALLVAGADPNFQAEERPPLHQAVSDGRRAVAERLVQAGASVNKLDGWDETPLHAAARAADLAMVDWLLSIGADPEACGEQTGMTVLHAAAAGGSVEVVDRLMRLGLSRAAKNARGETPEQLARRLGKEDAARILKG